MATLLVIFGIPFLTGKYIVKSDDYGETATTSSFEGGIINNLVTQLQREESVGTGSTLSFRCCRALTLFARP